MHKFRRFAYDCGVACLAAVIASSLVPLYLISLNPAEFWHFELGLFSVFSVLVALIFGAVGMLMYGLLAALRRPSWARSFVLFVLFWTTITGFVFPVVRSGEMIDAAGLSINYVNVLVALAFTVALVRLAMSKQLVVLPFVFVALVTLFTLIPAVPRFYQLSKASDAKAETRVELLSLSSQKNTVVLSFDGLPGNIVGRVLSQRPDLMNAFKDFVLFNKVICLAPATTASLTAEMFGNRNYRHLGKTQQEVLDNLELSTLPLNRAAGAGAATFTYGVYNVFNLENTRKFDTGDIDGGRQGDLLRATTLLEYAVARMTTSHAVRLLRDLGLMRHVVSRLTTGLSDPLLLRLLNHQGPRWDISYIMQKRDLDAFVANMRVGRSEEYIAFMHFLHTHFPIDLDSNCEYRSDAKTWYLHNQSEAGIENETICALSQAASLVDRLKALGVYEDTFLVVKSDHGQPALYYDEAPHSSRINRHPVHGVNRYRPFLLVKERGRVARRMEVVSERVTLGDLAPTLCRQLVPADATCNSFAGVNLVRPSEIPDETAIYVDVVRDERSTHEFGTQMTVEIERTADRTLADLLGDASEVTISTPMMGSTEEARRARRLSELPVPP